MTQTKQPSARKYGNAIRNALKNTPYSCTTKTIGFSGFGYGCSIVAEIRTFDQPITSGLRELLISVRNQFEALADDGNHFIIELKGPAYPFGGTIK